MANPQYGQNRFDNSADNQIGEAVLVAADKTLVAADSGKIIFAAAGGVDIVLPAPAAGLSYTIVQQAAYSSTANTIKCASTDGSVYFNGGYASADSGDGNTADNNSNDVITFGSATLAGDWIKLVSDGNHWFVVGCFAKSSDNSNGIVFSDA